MKEWFKVYKLYVFGVLLLCVVVGYYFFAPTPSDPLQITKTEPQLENEQTIDGIEQQKESLEEEVSQTIMVDLKGAIQKPGVYEAQHGERVIDLIERAGGFTETADQSKVNLAMYVEDQMVIAVPKMGEEVAGITINTGVGNQTTGDKVNINTADEAELETLPGIGPSKSAAIIEYRSTTGPFKAIEDIQSISGIGEKTFEKLKDKISID